MVFKNLCVSVRLDESSLSIGRVYPAGGLHLHPDFSSNTFVNRAFQGKYLKEDCLLSSEL